MNTTESIRPSLEKEHGFFNSQTINQLPGHIFSFCQEEENVEKILSDLPDGIDNFFDLALVAADQTAADQYEIKWKNKDTAKIQGSIAFYLNLAPTGRGTVLTAMATFDQFKMNAEGPSDLINIFIKRIKALIETGEIATTKGQPSGREELKDSSEQTLH